MTMNAKKTTEELLNSIAASLKQDSNDINGKPNINHWRQLFKNNTLSSIKNVIDDFIARHGVQYVFLNNDSFFFINDYHAMNTSSPPSKLGALLDIAAESATDVEIIRYLVETKQANLNISSKNSDDAPPLVNALFKKKFDIALYLLNAGTEMSREPQDNSESILSLTACCYEEDNEHLLTFIKALLKQGYWISNEAAYEQRTNINLAMLRNELLAENSHLRQEGNQLIDITQELIESVTDILNTNGPTAFYCMKTITPKVEINEIMLGIVIKELAHKGTPLAHLVCGLLLEGHIENIMPNRNLNETTYMEQRQQDACLFYSKASKEPTLKKATDVLLWQQRLQGPQSIINRSQQYDLTPPTELLPGYDSFAKTSVEIPLYRM